MRQRIQTLLRALLSGLYERDHVMSMALLTSVAGESLFLLGPPGVAKSMIARRLKLAFRGGRAFEYLMSRFSTPDEIFGPVSIRKLRDEDKYERLTSGYLPQSEVVFLDEIWKSSPSIQNALLTVLNERIYRNGDRDEDMPLQLLIAASNELPAQGEGLEALWDRFLVRCTINGVTRNEAFDAMITDTSDYIPSIPEEVLLDIEELTRWRDSICRIPLSPLIFEFIHELRNLLLSPSDTDKSALPIYVSDRRWKKAVNLMRTSAFLMGNSEVRLSDTLLLTHVIWSHPEELKDVNRLVTKAITTSLSNHLGIELAQERLDALRIELKCQTSSLEESQELRIVHSFYYQLSTRSGKPILMYISEFQALSSTEDSSFILMMDKLKTGAQILKKYERSRHPGIFPKDILQVHRNGNKVVVNSTEYSLLTTQNQPAVAPASPKPNIDASRRQLLQRVLEQNREVESQFLKYKEAEEQYLRDHLFADDDQRGLLLTALQNVTYTVRRLLTETEEICSL